jgi:hypothetical protein
VVYTGRIPLLEVTGDRVAERAKGAKGVCQVPDTCAQEYIYLSGLYVLAEQLQDIKTKNTAVKGIITKVTHQARTVNNRWHGGPCLPSQKAINIMYEKTPRSYPGRQVLLDCFLYCAQWFSLSDIGTAESFPREFLYDLAETALDYRPQQTKEMPHDHEERYMEKEGEEWDRDTDAWSFMTFRKTSR